MDIDGSQEDDEEEGALPEAGKLTTSNSMVVDKAPNTLFIKNVPPFLGRMQLTELFETIPGFKLLMLSDPNPAKRFARYGWIKFEEGTDVSEIMQKLNYTKLKDFEIHLVLHRDQENVPHIGHEIHSAPERIRLDLTKAIELTKTIDRVRGLECPFSVPDPAELSNEECRKALDKYIAYLRHGHLICFYCGMMYESDEGLFRKCGSIHLRAKPMNIGSGGANPEILPPAWIKNYEQRLDNLIKYQLSDEEMKKYGSRDETAELEEFCREHTIQIEAEKFRCSLCSKLFRASEFVHKHLHLKHEEELQKLKEDIEYFNNYLRDTNRPSFLVMQPIHRFGGGHRHFGNMAFRGGPGRGGLRGPMHRYHPGRVNDTVNAHEPSS